ncbi:MAG: imidazoleglycerol-phosphate dehydratase HisB [Fidelibacterota bacterium]|nr:MAG: imidazoleglycerol-phosphate dehydratase HisB [Candidatus Neomarinimicrobiota bacterium]
MTKAQPIEIQRTTKETNITLELRLEGERTIQVDTGIGFFDHMLETLAFWGGWDLKLVCEGDLNVDAHHTVEDVALCLGQAFSQAREGREEIERFGWALVPLDEALSQVAVDLSGRPFTVFQADFGVEHVGGFETSLTGHFFRSFTTEARLNLHVRSLNGHDAHHMIETMFKGLALAVRQALTPRPGGVASTKGAV